MKFSEKQKMAARQKVRKAILKGELTKPDSCTVCDGEWRIEGHHPDYADPLRVVWLCYECHFAVHKRPERAGDVCNKCGMKYPARLHRCSERTLRNAQS